MQTKTLPTWKSTTTVLLIIAGISCSCPWAIGADEQEPKTQIGPPPPKPKTYWEQAYHVSFGTKPDAYIDLDPQAPYRYTVTFITITAAKLAAGQVIGGEICYPGQDPSKTVLHVPLPQLAQVDPNTQIQLGAEHVFFRYWTPASSGNNSPIPTYGIRVWRKDTKTGGDITVCLFGYNGLDDNL